MFEWSVFILSSWCVSNHFYCESWERVFGKISPKLSQVNENFPSVEEKDLHIVLCIGIYSRYSLFASSLQRENMRLKSPKFSNASNDLKDFTWW